MNAYGLSALAVGTVTSTDPLEVIIRESMAPLPQEVLRLTAAVIEKKIPVLAHKHTTTGFRHSHAVSGLSHSHEASEGPTGASLDGSYQTGEALTQDSYLSDEQLGDIAGYEAGAGGGRIHYPEPGAGRGGQGAFAPGHAGPAVCHSVPGF